MQKPSICSLKLISKREIGRQGEVLARGSSSREEYEHARDVLDKWRAAHQYPMEQIEAEVREASSGVDGSLCASRLKRADTIIRKLQRTNSNLSLKTLDDIAGCRCIVPTVEDVVAVREKLLPETSFMDEKNYIDRPKVSGYRGIHQIHNCDSFDGDYKKLRVEVQIRTKLQHAWATAVETYDLLSNSSLKFEAGTEEESRAFALLSNLIAGIEECSLVPYMPESAEKTREEFIELNSRLQIIPKLNAFRQCVSLHDGSQNKRNVGYYLLEFDFISQLVIYTSYSPDEGKTAQCEFAKKEREKGNEADVLLVKADSLENLREAYPNYFSDITPFLELVKQLNLE